MDEIPVLVTLTGRTPEDAPEEESIRMITAGMLTPLRDGWKLIYQETNPEDNSVSEITLLVGSGRVMMSRTGDFAVSMVFRKDQHFESAYRTPWGDMRMALFATRVDVNMQERRGRIVLEYQLEFQGGDAVMHFLELSYLAREGAPL